MNRIVISVLEFFKMMRIQFLHSQKWQKRHLLSPSNAAPQLKTLPKNISHSPKTPKESHSPQIPLLASISDHKQLVYSLQTLSFTAAKLSSSNKISSPRQEKLPLPVKKHPQKYLFPAEEALPCSYVSHQKKIKMNLCSRISPCNLTAMPKASPLQKDDPL